MPAGDYTFQLIADDVGTYNGLQFDYFVGSPAVNDNGVVAFRGAQGPIDPVHGVYTGTGTTTTKIFEDSDILESEEIGELGDCASINNSGTVSITASFSSRIITGNGATSSVLYKDGGPENFLGFGLFAQINNSGTVAFVAQHSDATDPGIYTGNGGAVTLIQASPPGHIADPMLNDDGDVAWYADGGGMYINHGGTTHLVADQVDYPAGTAGNINSQGVAAFTAGPIGQGGPESGYVTATFDGTRTTVVDSSGAFDELSAAAINYNASTSEQLIAFVAEYDVGSSSGIFTGPSVTADKVIEIGDTLFGQEVQTFSFFSWGLNDSGQIAFYATLDDGGDGRDVVVLATVVPEPASALLLLVGAAIVLRRRRK